MSAVAGLYRRNRDKAAAYDRDAALRESQARLATFAEATFEGIVESEEGRIVDCNEQFARMLGYSVAELKGIEIASLIAPEDRARVTANILFSQDSTNQHTALRRDGTRIVVEAHGRSVSPGFSKRYSAVRDVTARRQAEDALRETKERLSVTLTSIGDAVVTVDTSGRIAFLNPVAVTLTGWEPEDAIGQPVQSVFKIVNEKTQLAAEDIVQRVLLEGHVIALADHTVLVTKNGCQVPIEDSAAPIKDQDGKVSGVVLVFHDVSEKRRSQEALLENEERYRNLFDNMAEAFALHEIVTDEQGALATIVFSTSMTPSSE